MQDKIDDLRQRREQAYHGGFPPGRRAPARQGQADRPGAHRVPARRRARSTSSSCWPAPGDRLRPGGAAVHRRCHHRLGHGRGPQGLRVRAGLPVFGGALGEVFAEKIHKIMDMASGRRAGGRAERRRRRPYPGGRRQPRQLRRHLPPQRAVVRCHPADLRDPRPVRRRRGVQPGDDGLHLHGARDVADVHHRTRRREDGDRRGRHPEGPRRRDEPRLEVRRRHFVADDEKSCLDEVRYLLSFLPAEQPREPAARRRQRRPRPALPRAARPRAGRPNRPTTCTRSSRRSSTTASSWSTSRTGPATSCAASPASTAGRSASSATSR